ncbi:hypothetical protein [Gimesia sp.]|uniref:hypothetical protein n=1 Tax=Gimesia sp. TaxID=2024833 RepID=UPI003A8CE2E3
MKTDNNICKIDVCYDEYCNGLWDYYRKGRRPISEALRDQANFLQWNVDLLRKLAEEVERFGEDDLKLDVEELTIAGPNDLIQRLIDEKLAVPYD